MTFTHSLIFFAAKLGETIQSAKTRPGTDCGSDRELIIAKFRIKLKRVGKTMDSIKDRNGMDLIEAKDV